MSASCFGFSQHVCVGSPTLLYFGRPVSVEIPCMPVQVERIHKCIYNQQLISTYLMFQASALVPFYINVLYNNTKLVNTPISCPLQNFFSINLSHLYKHVHVNNIDNFLYLKMCTNNTANICGSVIGVTHSLQWTLISLHLQKNTISIL